MRPGSTTLVAALSWASLAALPYPKEGVAADLRVDRNNMTATRDGSALRPYVTIQAALDAASAGDSVLVARGAYAENVRIEGKRIELRGGYAGASSADYAANRGGSFSTQNPAANVTTIQAADGDASTVSLLLTETSGSLVDGFTVRGGSHGIELDDNFTFPTLTGVTISRNVLEQNGVAQDGHFGGGLYLSGADHVVTDNVIRNNVGGRGAGASICCDNVMFRRNRVEDNMGYSDHGGGIIQIGTTVLTDNVIRGNRTGEGLGYGWGGGILIVGMAELSRNTFTENYAPGVGGAVIVDEGARAVFEHDLFFANSARAGGGAIYVDGGEPGPSRADIRHCTITGNTNEESPAGNAVFVEGGSSVTLINTIVWNNEGDDFATVDTSTITATYTLSEEDIAGTGNISADPLFANAAANDYHLRSTAGRWDPSANGGAGGFVIDSQNSPAIDAADPAAPFSAEPAPNGGRANLGVYGNTAEASKSGSGPGPSPTPTRTGGGATPTPSRSPTRTATRSPTPQQQFYVAPGGDDDNSGSESSPWQTLQKAADSAAPGTDVVVLAGEYEGFRARVSGAPGAPIRFLARPGVVVTAPGAANSNGDNIWLRNVEYIVLDGFESRDAVRAGIAVQGEPDANVSGVVIRNCFCHDNGRWGIFTSFARDLLIEDNETSFSSDEHGIYVSNSGDRVVVRRNHVHDNFASGIQLNADPAQQGDDPNDPQGDGIIEEALIESNRIHDNGARGGAGINLASVRSSLIRNNILYGNHGSGIAGWDDDFGGNEFGTRNNRFIGNTVVQASDGRFALSLINGSFDNVVENNILIHRGSRGSLEVDPASREGLQSNYNVVVDVFSDNEDFFDLAAWRDLGFDANSILATVAELFADESADDYRLSATSPARDRGSARADLQTDFAGRPRPQGPGLDIGAYEFGDSVATCDGDCNGDGLVTVDEVLIGVAGMLNDLLTCNRFDINGDGTATIDELAVAVRNLLQGCTGSTE